MEDQYRQRIIDESGAYFMKYGIRAVTMDRLANELGISKRSIYEHFANKDELLFAVFTTMGERQHRTVMRLIEESETVIHAIFEMLEITGRHMRKLNPLFIDDLRKYHPLVNKRLAGKRYDMDVSVPIALVKRGIKEKIFREDININLVARALNQVFRNTSDFILFPKEEFSREDVVRDFFLNYLRGISTVEGLKLIGICERKMLNKY